jgi:fluoride exporter
MARFLIDSLISSRATGGLPLGTFVVNVTGSLLLGLLVGLAVGGELLVLAGAAALGSYTTFSTWMFETRRLVGDARAPAAIVNVLLSLVAGVAAAALGRAIGGQL